MSDVTSLLLQIESGDPSAAEQLLPLVYEELRKLAAAKLVHEQPGQTLQATALVHEAYLRLVGPVVGDRESGAGEVVTSDSRSPTPVFWQSRGHFFAAAAEAMRRILVDRARAKHRLKRGGDRRRLEIDSVEMAVEAAPDQLLAIDEALDKLGREEPAILRLVQLRYFAGLTIEQTAAALGISAATAYRQWNYARAWLHAELLDA
jgi:RNA polymerase sigma factor (sigma-70 family)